MWTRGLPRQHEPSGPFVFTFKHSTTQTQDYLLELLLQPLKLRLESDQPARLPVKTIVMCKHINTGQTQPTAASMSVGNGHETNWTFGKSGEDEDTDKDKFTPPSPSSSA